ncbi:MAG TPA: BamA/TamA family outer membrane protein, partial [Woeseiaceae bacterium]|nr:BamA/TamA family outer membrane protein [Woeseiaceae bacterium]
NSGRFSKLYSLSYTDPYVTQNNVQRTISVSHRDITAFVSGASDFSTTSTGASLEYAYPLSEYQTLTFGLAYQNAELLSSSTSTQQSQDWVTGNGNPFSDQVGGVTFLGTQFNAYELITGWTYDSRNRALFADRGTRHQFFLGVTAPGSEVEYFTGRYNFTKYVPIYGPFTVRVNTELAYGEALGDTTALPPYKQFFGGGPESVRGYKESYLGPRDSFGRPYGGNVLVASQVELILPIPEKWRGQTRASLFYDIGNVFNTGEVEFTDKLGSPVTYKPEFNELKTSVGVSVQWLAPLGFFRFSYAIPLNQFKGNDRFYGDQIERFQFSIGQAF